MLQSTETSKKPKFLKKKLQKFQVILEKNAKIWIFTQFSLKTLKYDTSYPRKLYKELRRKLYKVLIKGKAPNDFKPTETSKKIKIFGKKLQKFQVFGKKLQKPHNYG